MFEYPSFNAFIDMQRDKKYQAVFHYQDEALEDSRLIAIKVACRGADKIMGLHQRLE